MGATRVVGSRTQDPVRVKDASRVQRARKQGPHGGQVDASGHKNSEPKAHPKTDGGGKSGLDGVTNRD